MCSLVCEDAITSKAAPAGGVGGRWVRVLGVNNVWSAEQLRWSGSICVLSDSLPDFSSLHFTRQRSTGANGLCGLMRNASGVAYHPLTMCLFFQTLPAEADMFLSDSGRAHGSCVEKDRSTVFRSIQALAGTTAPHPMNRSLMLYGESAESLTVNLYTALRKRRPTTCIQPSAVSYSRSLRRV